LKQGGLPKAVLSAGDEKASEDCPRVRRHPRDETCLCRPG
jgi:hypothetical protein